MSLPRELRAVKAKSAPHTPERAADDSILLTDPAGKTIARESLR
ncbi:MAG: hypothetical protein NTX64_19045 [Elusimicrobia bacterium]|nr:hypothetical protein [Elusimicrobiota bacterium]